MSEALWRSVLDRRKEMRWKLLLAATASLWMGVNPYAVARPQAAASQTPTQMVADPIEILVDRLDLEQYKATIKGLTQFGDRRQGTDRNRAAIDWIEAQLQTYGCANIARLAYSYQPLPSAAGPAAVVGTAAQADNAASGAAGGVSGGVAPATPTPPTTAAGGGRPRGIRAPTGVNNDPNGSRTPSCGNSILSPATRARAKRSTARRSARRIPRRCTSSAAHMDGIGWGEAANDDGSGTALVMELARVFSSPDVGPSAPFASFCGTTRRPDSNGARAYVEQRKDLQGKEDPPGSGKYPEPKWLGMIQHDMMMFDHGMPRADGTVSKEQRPEADVNIEFQVNSKLAGPIAGARWAFERRTKSTRRIIRRASAAT